MESHVIRRHDSLSKSISSTKFLSKNFCRKILCRHDTSSIGHFAEKFSSTRHFVDTTLCRHSSSSIRHFVDTALRRHNTSSTYHFVDISFRRQISIQRIFSLILTIGVSYMPSPASSPWSLLHNIILTLTLGFPT